MPLCLPSYDQVFFERQDPSTSYVASLWITDSSAPFVFSGIELFFPTVLLGLIWSFNFVISFGR